MTCEPLPTAELADAAGELIAMAARIRPVWRGARLGGPAFTVRTPPGEHQAVRNAAEQAPPGSVIVIDAGGELERALWGDRMARLASERRIAGLVIDGAVRDVDGIEALAFPVFAAGCCPTPPHRDQPGELGIEIMCGAMRVRPGDIIYGDTDGVVVIPAEHHRQVLSRLPASLIT